MNITNITPDETTKAMEEEIRCVIKSQYTWKAQLADNIFAIIGILVIVIATIWLVQDSQSFSQSLSELAPNAEAFKLNMEKIGILLSIEGVRMTIIQGTIGIGIGMVAIGMAWSSYRSSRRITQILINIVGLSSYSVLKGVAVGIEHLDKRLNERNHRKRAKRG